ncbi:[FeFe] hydrogenase H-cluster radical SAM maturase HydE [Myxococcota bacterium]|nr:[FeFe] hydrogenase H-cluster radical SAM maturase HydE [Myxococcota bacterium]MBU1429306.1 [FeFe] hydrogenase H-cluster radical SAM maturase HydE [Myxococcota bacterium]MBU1899308.1 [FeFe] hydrogenase H-cluster radical SAM maturase HydE [Myxococcota bacterium]
MIDPATLDAAAVEAWLREEAPPRLEALRASAEAHLLREIGPVVYLRGLVEISNHCKRACLYCGLRAGRRITRYRMSHAEILACAAEIERRGYGTMVIQAGEDPALDVEWVRDLIAATRARHDLAITLSLGERPDADLRVWREAGADRYLLRFESSRPALFDRLHPAHPEGQDRLAQLRSMAAMGYQIGSGMLVGAPGQTYADLVRDILILRELELHMIGLGPWVAHPETPLGRDPHAFEAAVDQVPASEAMTLKVLALARHMRPRAHIPSTTALATINRRQGRAHGLHWGANVVMPNITPLQYRRDYEIYPAKGRVEVARAETEAEIRANIQALGRRVGLGKGHAR